MLKTTGPSVVERQGNCPLIYSASRLLIQSNLDNSNCGTCSNCIVGCGLNLQASTERLVYVTKKMLTKLVFSHLKEKFLHLMMVVLNESKGGHSNNQCCTKSTTKNFSINGGLTLTVYCGHIVLATFEDLTILMEIFTIEQQIQMILLLLSK